MSAPRRPRSVQLAAAGVGLLAVLLVVLLFTRDVGGDRQSASPLIGQPAPGVEGAPLVGESFDIGANDRWLVVNFFATWCVPCVQEHPELRKLDEDLGADGRGRVISIAYDDQPEAVAKFFRDEGGDWPVLDSDNGRTALDWGVTKVPESFLVAPTGIVVQRIQGGVLAAEIEDLIGQYEEAAS